MARGKVFTKTNWGAKIALETTPNTYKTPIYALCLEKGKGSVGNPEYEKYACDMMSAYDGDTYDIVLDSDSGKVSVDVDMAMPKANSIMLQALFQGAGLKYTDGTKTYSPKTASDKRLSIEVSQLRRQYQIKGALANLKLQMKAGSMVRMQTTFVGGLNGDAIEKTAGQTNFAIPKNPLDVSQVAWIKSKCGLTINGVADYWISNAELDIGIEFNTTNDYCGKISRITNRKTVLTVTFKNTEKNETPLKDLRDGKEYNIGIDIHDNNGNVIWQLKIPKAKVSEDSTADVDGYLETTRTFIAVSTVGDDNFAIVAK